MLMSIMDIFIAELGEPDSYTALEQYIDITSNNYDGSEYAENHHILPRCKFKLHPGYKLNVVRLKYSDHVMAHILLFEAYRIKSFQAPLNWMTKIDDDQKQFLSIERKKEWTIFRQTDKYLVWCKKRCITTNNFEKFIAAGISSSKERNKDLDYRTRISKSVKKTWDTKDKIEWSDKIKQSFIDNDTHKKLSKNSKELWQDPMFIKKRKDSLSVVMASHEYRRNLSNAIQNKLNTDPSYLEKLRTNQMISAKARKEKNLKIKSWLYDNIISNSKELLAEYENCINPSRTEGGKIKKLNALYNRLKKEYKNEIKSDFGG